MKALEELDKINLISLSEIDSLKCSINAPYNTDYFKYYCKSFLDIPFEMPCFIKSPNQDVFASNLGNIFYVQDSFGKIEIKSHEGSCDVI